MDLVKNCLAQNSFIKLATNSVQLFEMNRGPGKMYSSNSSAPAYNLLDHPEVRRPQMSNETYQNESRRINYNRSHSYNFYDRRYIIILINFRRESNVLESAENEFFQDFFTFQ